jgi:hypothetical protein
MIKDENENYCDEALANAGAKPETAEEKKAAGKGKKTQKQADIMIRHAERESELFHTPDGETWADINIHGHRETWLLRSKGFKRWLVMYFREMEGRRQKRCSTLRSIRLTPWLRQKGTSGRSICGRPSSTGPLCNHRQFSRSHSERRLARQDARGLPRFLCMTELSGLSIFVLWNIRLLSQKNCERLVARCPKCHNCHT